jgi:hypothetical protein
MDDCLYCRSPLFPGSRSRYCSSACRQAAYRLRRNRHFRSSLSALTQAISQVHPPSLRLSMLESLQSIARML